MSPPGRKRGGGQGDDKIEMKTIYVIFICIFYLFSHPLPAHAMMSVQEERKLGEKLLKMVKKEMTLINDPEITAYVNEAGQKILKNVGPKYFDYHFFVIQDEGFNAFAMPGGYVFIHSGLLEAFDRESELEAVLAHEIGHVQGRHIARRMDQMKKVTLASAATAIAGLFLGSGKAGTAILATSGALNQSIALKYSREDEEEADRRAYQWMCKAGYDPSGLSSVMKKIQQNRWLGSDSIPSYLSTHPGAGQRMTYLEYLLRTDPCPFDKEKEKNLELKRLQVKIETSTKDPIKVTEKYRKKLKNNPDDIISLYGLANALHASREYGDAIKTFNTLVLKAPEISEFRLELAIAYLDSGKYMEAKKTLEKYHKNHQDDMQADYYLGKSYLETGEADKALPLFFSIKDEWPDQADINLNLGRTYANLGRNGKSHYHLYLHYQSLGDDKTAEFHKKMALKLLPKKSALYKKLSEKKTEKKDEK